jgi:hypothetical protein
MPAPDSVLSLVERFREHRDEYLSAGYNEATLRREFLEPMFKALGWDMDNTEASAEAYKQVVHEDAIKVSGSTRAPDYAFRLGGVRKFFVEAKKPSVDVKGDPSPAYQLRRYAWSAKLPLSILTDFHEFAVYDCTAKPDPTDRATAGRILYLSCEEYAERWDEIAGLFSPDAIRKGAFDKYAASARKKGTSTVDDAFLKEIETWRDLLARNLALRNPDLTQRELNGAVQTTIDRIIFLRICEDRGIEDYGVLRGLLNGTCTYERLLAVFRAADERYNSGLFHFRSEKDRPGEPDTLTPRLTIDDKALKEILDALYYPKSPYEFSVLPADILGHVYEQFLGKVIRLTAGHHAVVEEKPEVKKAGGVYYTPTYIVDYIVKNTVGKLLDGMTPKEAGSLCVLDPACGSGSFLLGAYQLLLNWHQAWYAGHDPEKWARGRRPRVFRGQDGEWRLTTAERKRILLDCIYGVDIDPQAVEVTKLSLLLKVLEGEDTETLVKHLRLFRERALPDLGKNIQCGNSLIGSDFYDEHLIDTLTEEERYRINAFDWEAAFPEPMRAGGFDVVIGNPPYIRIQAMKEWAPIEVEYYKTAYAAASKGNYDIYVVFVEKGLSLLNPRGRLGFILPHKFFNAQYGEPLRRLIAEGRHLSEVVHFGDLQVFPGASTYTALLLLERSGADVYRVCRVENLESWRSGELASVAVIPSVKLGAEEWNLSNAGDTPLLDRLLAIPTKLSDTTDRVFQGVITGADRVFLMTRLRDGVYLSSATRQEHSIEADLMRPLCKGSVHLRRYKAIMSDLFLLFPYEVTEGRATLIQQQTLQSVFPGAWRYLELNREALEARERGKWRNPNWYAFSRSQNLGIMEQPKIMTPSIAAQASFSLDQRGYLYFVGSGGGGGGGYGITLKRALPAGSEFVLLGLLNSRLLDWVLKRLSSPFRGSYFAYSRQYIERLPIRIVDCRDLGEGELCGQIGQAAERMIDLTVRTDAARTDHERENLQRQLEMTDRKIDRLVYELYGLTVDEIHIVEEAPRL